MVPSSKINMVKIIYENQDSSRESQGPQNNFMGYGWDKLFQPQNDPQFFFACV